VRGTKARRSVFEKTSKRSGSATTRKLDFEKQEIRNVWMPYYGRLHEER
jgi:hypothetical protein